MSDDGWQVYYQLMRWVGLVMFSVAITLTVAGVDNAWVFIGKGLLVMLVGAHFQKMRR